MILTLSLIYRVTESFIDKNLTHTPCHKVGVMFRRRIVEKAGLYLSGLDESEIPSDFMDDVVTEMHITLSASGELIVALVDLVAAIKAEADSAESQ